MEGSPGITAKPVSADIRHLKADKWHLPYGTQVWSLYVEPYVQDIPVRNNIVFSLNLQSAGVLYRLL